MKCIDRVSGAVGWVSNTVMWLCFVSFFIRACTYYNDVFSFVISLWGHDGVSSYAKTWTTIQIRDVVEPLKVKPSSYYFLLILKYVSVQNCMLLSGTNSSGCILLINECNLTDSFE